MNCWAAGRDLQMTIFGYTWDEIKRGQQGGDWRGEYQPGFQTAHDKPKAIGNCWSATAKPSCGTEVISSA